MDDDAPLILEGGTGSKRNHKAIATASQEAGKAFEDAVDRELLALQQRGYVAYWEKNKPGWAKRGPKWVRTEASGADRAGILRGGIGFALEVKSTGLRPNGQKNAFQRDRISLRQEAHLDQAMRAGAPALLALEWRLADENVWCLMPWGAVEWNGKKSFQFDGWVLGHVVAAGGFADAFLACCGATPAGRALWGR